MKFKLYRQHGALNSPALFDAFDQGLKKIGHVVSDDTDSIPVIWSVLWYGRMKPNQQIYNNHRINGIPVVIIEVGNFHRGKTWRISVNNVNRLGYFGEGAVDRDRPKKIQVDMKSPNHRRRSEVLIACQHRHSLQWPENMSIESWVSSTVDEIAACSDRKIVVRPHPRCPINLAHKRVTVNHPRKLAASYDDYDFDHRYHAVINYNTGPAIQAALNGTPVVCDQSALAYPISDVLSNIENPQLKDRESWMIDLCHKEWTVDEISAGVPQSRLSPFLETEIS